MVKKQVDLNGEFLAEIEVSGRIAVVEIVNKRNTTITWYRSRPSIHNDSDVEKLRDEIQSRIDKNREMFDDIATCTTAMESVLKQECKGFDIEVCNARDEGGKVIGKGVFEHKGEEESVKCTVSAYKTMEDIGYRKSIVVKTGSNVSREISDLNPSSIRSMVSDVRNEWEDNVEEEKEWEEEVNEALDDLE